MFEKRGCREEDGFIGREGIYETRKKKKKRGGRRKIKTGGKKRRGWDFTGR